MPASDLLRGTGSLWHQRIQSAREYEVVRDGNVFGTGFSACTVPSSEYEAGCLLLNSLLDRYRGLSIGAVVRGTEVTNEGGVCYVRTSKHDLSHRPLDTARFRAEFLADLTLIRGIGHATEERLKFRGYATIADLLSHPRYRNEARRVIDVLSHGCTSEIIDLIGRRRSRSDPCILGSAGLHEMEDYLFFDIETLGLFGRPIILLGIGSIQNRQLNIFQYLLRDVGEEQPALLETADHFSRDHPLLVTFNGKAFDLPYLRDRFSYYGMDSPSRIPHLDLLHFSRRRWKGQIPSLRLTSLERKILGISRDRDIPGQMVPDFYHEYQKSGNCGPLVAILDHNRQDVVSLVHLFFHLAGESYGCC